MKVCLNWNGTLILTLTSLNMLTLIDLSILEILFSELAFIVGL